MLKKVEKEGGNLGYEENCYSQERGSQTDGHVLLRLLQLPLAPITKYGLYRENFSV